jgi:hypothetical protein
VSVEYWERADYGSVLNAQLDRVAAQRSEIGQISPFETSRLRGIAYSFAVEALYMLLLPELREGLEEPLMLMKKMRVSEDAEEIDELVERLPEPYRGLAKASPRGIEFVYASDYLLSLILERLNKAGLLLRGRAVKVGV